jgi:Fic family protein
MMPLLFELLSEETDPAVRVVLGYFVFVYIYPYIDGNGRMGRFLMNVILAAGGYPWTVIPVQRRKDYMSALEAASVNQDIKSFTTFLGGLVNIGRRECGVKYRQLMSLYTTCAATNKERCDTVRQISS